jgi:hypothetical protein
MRRKPHLFALLVAAVGVLAATLTAPVAAAAPDCRETAPRTTLCQSSGSAQLTTTPPRVFVNPYPFYGFGWGGITIGG